MDGRFYDGRSNAIVLIKKRFETEQITIAYPVRTSTFDVKGGVNIFNKDVSVKVPDASHIFG